jgi:hypothetical protein
MEPRNFNLINTIQKLERKSQHQTIWISVLSILVLASYATLVYHMHIGNKMANTDNSLWKNQSTINAKMQQFQTETLEGFKEVRKFETQTLQYQEVQTSTLLDHDKWLNNLLNYMQNKH